MRLRQLEMKIPKHGGKRKGAGRKKILAGEPSHAKRPKVSMKEPLGITMKLKTGLSSLRSMRHLKSFKKAMNSAKKFGVSVTHFSLLSNHAHLVVEVENNRALECGMKSLTVTLAAAINRLRLRNGPVFQGRFHLHKLKTPTEVRRAIDYVVHNFTRHLKIEKFTDAFSSAADGAETSPPRSWLLREGWRRGVD